MVKRFLSYVEIKTKITSIFTFLMTIAFLFYKSQQINWELTFLFFTAMFLFDLATTAINNYIDTKTNDQKLQFNRSIALMIIMVLLAVSTSLSLYLVYLTDIVVFILGAICFLSGILYTYGPVPISRQPLGEILSGVFYGFFIPFILLYINMPEGTYLTFDLNLQSIDITLQIFPLFSVIMLSVIPVSATANIMLANNICDLEHDILVRRYTLPYYLGIRKAICLLAGIYYICYPAVVIMVVFRIISPLCLVYLITIVPVQRNIRIFFKEQDKNTTFMISIKNYIVIMGTISLLIFLSGLIQ
ncbi:MAG: UbiA family prenyltransferase [Eubacteriales bacterium]|nr:UbiA family prenyltransferase [Eubacteriales bacterium]MDD3198771.1 UbiA family prenyltransferase [Eubacteriales bacterium]MDD4121438.1 UbiA family prenyltransferase [Eubacteriales bacterium]MDD4628983.1 UbiA family prenyltransferase [Eubacteriales bacterium]